MIIKKYDDPNLNRNGSFYGARMNEFGDYVIVNRTVNCYLLIGEEKALLIDTAYGDGDLKRVIDSLTDLPVFVVNTHMHLDHSGGNKFFTDIWKDEEKKDGTVFNLGGREVEAIAIGAHHPTSFAFLDRKNRTLYTGDEVESGQVLLFCSGEDVEERILVERHRENMKKLLARKDEYDRLMPAHNGAPIACSYIEDFIGLSDRILEGEIQAEKTVAGYGMPTFLWGGDRKLQRFRYAKASFIMSRK